jgi:hypothetical protein
MAFKRASIAVVLVLCAVAALSCSKSPTSSNTGPQASFSVSVLNTANAATLEDVQLLVDGNVIVEDTSAALTNYNLAGSIFLASGTHTLGVKIITQTVSPSTYTVTPVISIYNADDVLTNTIAPTPITSSLATGGQDTFTFSF